MRAPELLQIPQTKDIIQQFKGYNHNIRIGEDEFYDMKNMSSDSFPTLSPRSKRGISKEIPDCNGVLSKDKLAYVSGNKLYYDGKEVLELDSATEGERQLVSMGAYIVIYPDLMYYNTANPTDKGSIYSEPKTFEEEMTLALVDNQGKKIEPEDLIYESYLNSCPFWSLKDGYDKHNESNSARLICVNPFKNRDSNNDADRYIRLVGLPANHTNNVGSYTEISYEYKFEPSNWGVKNNEPIYTVFETRDALTLCFEKNRLNELQNDLMGTFSDNPAGEFNYPKFGHITITRKITQYETKEGDDILYEYEDSRTYDIVSRIQTLVDNHTGQRSIAAWGEQYPIIKGDKRLISKDGVSVIEECVKIADEKPNENKYITTWNTSSCWSPVETFVKITSNKYSPIGADVQTIIDNSSEEALILTSSNFATNSLEKRYSAGNVNFVKYNAKKISDYDITVNGCLDLVVTQSPGIVLQYKVIPKVLDYVIECNNRLWGCRYGKDNRGNFVNEIYATEQGSFAKWDNLDGTDAASYKVSLGSDGKFTGAVNYNGRPIFFKENCAHMVYGAYPSSYSIVTDTGMSLQDGSHKSLSIASNILYYKAADGVYTYNGASYDKISEALGKEAYTDAIGCATASKYYLSMVGEDNERKLFVFDTKLGLWHVEDDINVSHIINHKGGVYLYDKTDSILYTVGSTPENAESDDVEWYCESGIIGFSTHDSKYISKLQLRLSLPVGSNVSFLIEYDSDGYWEFIGSLEGVSLRAFSIPILPRKCDHFKIRIEGKGECKIYSISKVMVEGGE
jgi:hypothetical protein